MKKLTVTLIAIIMLISCAVLPASAVNYTNSGFSVDIPDELIANEELALEYDMTMTWLSEDENFDFSLSVEPNDENYTYVNYSKSELQEIYDDYVEGEEGYTLENSQNITTASGFEGIRIDIAGEYLGVTFKHIVCAFSTKTMVYTLYFYVYDEAYLSYVDAIINTVSIEGNDYDAEKEANIEYVAYLAGVMIVSAIISAIKKRAAKKKAASAQHQPVTGANSGNVVFNPATDASPEFNQSRINSEPAVRNDANDFAAKEAEKERKEREELFK